MARINRHSNERRTQNTDAKRGPHVKVSSVEERTDVAAALFLRPRETARTCMQDTETSIEKEGNIFVGAVKCGG
jgi:hypothetical protein